MMRLVRRLSVMLAAGLIVAAGPVERDDPASYALRVALTPAPGGSVQRVVLPAEVLAASRTRDLGDMRVFDGRGRAVPIARAAPVRAAPRRDTLAALPILGAPDALRVTGVSLRLDGEGRARIAQVDGTPVAAGADAVVVGVLFDVRRITGDAVALTLDAQVPAGQPVTFTVEASEDLQNWRSLGDKVVYRAPGGAGTDGDAIALGSAALNGTYLRATWRAASRLLSPVSVRAATLQTRPDGGSASVVTAPATAPALIDPRTVEFAVPFTTAINSIGVLPIGSDTPVPIRVLGRDDNEQPWRLLGEGIASLRSDARAIMLGGTSARALRIEANPKSAGFAQPPRISFGFVPAELVFNAAGPPPFSLAAGRVDAPDPYLALSSIVERPDDALPVAMLAAASPGPPALTAVNNASAQRRQWLLWGILLAATALLGTMAWVLSRRAGPSPVPSESEGAPQ